MAQHPQYLPTGRGKLENNGGKFHMATDEQVKANQQNATHSTGPRNTEVTRYNATRHGFRGRRVVIDGESEAEYNALIDSLYESFLPADTYETYLVRRIGDRMWELERARHMKVNALNEAQYRDAMQAELQTLEYYEGRIERSMLRIRRELFAVQATRREHRQHPRVTPEMPNLYTNGNGHGHQNGNGNGNGHTPGSQPGRLFFVTGDQYRGPGIAFFHSQGEAGLESLLWRAKVNILRESGEFGQLGLKNLIRKRADQELAADPANYPTPAEREALEARKADVRPPAPADNNEDTPQSGYLSADEVAHRLWLKTREERKKQRKQSRKNRQ
jgi:hypothetical protein